MIKKLFGLFFLIAIANCLVRINIWHDKLKQLCFSRGDNLYPDLIANQESLSSHLSKFHVTNLEYTSQINKCQNDNNSTLLVQLLVDAVQLCMDEQNRLLADQKEIFISRLLAVVCQLHVLGGGTIHDRHCMNTTGSQLSACKQTIQEFPTILLPLIYNTEECSEAERIFICLQNEISECDEATRNEFQAANNVTLYTLYGCQNQQTNDFHISKVNENKNVDYIKPIFNNEAIIRLNITKTDLEEKCKQKGENFAKNVEKTFRDFLSVKEEKQFAIGLAMNLKKLKKREQLQAIVNEYCFQDLDIKNSLKTILNAVEQCLDEENRLEEEKREKFLMKSVDKFCSGLDITAILVQRDHECFHDIETFFKWALCSPNVSVKHNFFDSLPLLFASSEAECNILYRIQNCKLNVHEDCKESTKNWLQSQFNQERTFTGCDDILYDTTFNDS